MPLSRSGRHYFKHVPSGEGRQPRVAATARIAELWWRPQADIYETADSLVVAVDLAGVDQNDLEVQLFADGLVIRGRRRLRLAGSNALYHQAQIRQGRFLIEVSIPVGVDASRVEATYESGLLQIVFGKVNDA
jgi:HSP20 family molecular chaperone IbpA